MKVFISQPMIDKTDEEILDERNKAIDNIRKQFNTNDVEILDSYFKDFKVVPGYNINKPLYFLGKAMQILAQADYAYFCKDWDKYRGCKTEHFICNQYGIKNNIDG